MSEPSAPNLEVEEESPQLVRNEKAYEEPVEAQVKSLDQSIEDNFITADKVGELEEVTSIAVFSTNVVNWHTNNMNQLAHAMNMPEVHPEDGTYLGVTITSDNVERGAKDGARLLHPKEIEAFKAGIRYAYDQCVMLPFKFIPTDADDNINPEYLGDGKSDAEQEPQAGN